MLRLLLFPLCLLLTNPAAMPVKPAGQPSKQQPISGNGKEPVKIQVALLLDTSNSMDGLIDQAKSQLWKMVNRLADAKRQFQDVVLEISLYEYGNAGLDQKKGYIRRVQTMKADLDGLSEQLFALHTNGGDEYCGWVIQTSLDSLGWSKSPDDLRLVIIAGNEPFDQGPIDFRQSCENAVQKDIIVNTIFCGDMEEGRRTRWFDCTQIAKGKYLNINTNERVEHIPTPFDSTLIRLNDGLNKTYYGYGKRGVAMKQRQASQDANATEYGAANMAQRASAKAKKSYSNSDWDLVDAYTADSTFVEKIDKEELPEALKKKSKDELRKEIVHLQRERAAIRKELIEVEKKMQAYIVAVRKSRSDSQTLDNVLIDALTEQAKARGFTFE